MLLLVGVGGGFRSENITLSIAFTVDTANKYSWWFCLLLEGALQRHRYYWAMQQNTSPVVIQDKNGKTTTVHRKNESTPSFTPSLLPPPSLVSPASSPVQDALRDLSELGIDLHGSDYGAANITYLAGHPNTLNAVIEAIRESDEDTRKNIWECKIARLDMHPDDEDDDYDYRKSYWRMIKTIPLGKVLYPGKDATSRRRDVDGVVRTSERGMGWWPTAKKYTEVQAAMIAVVAGGEVSNFGFKGRMDDIFFMADNLEKVIPLIPALLERGDTSRGYVEALLKNEAAVLDQGVL